MSVIELSQSNFDETLSSNDIVIIDFWAPWCGPCLQFAPTFKEASEKIEGVTFAKVNTEQAQKVSAEATIRSIPTLIFFLHGKEIDRVSGGLSESQLKNWIVQSLQKLD